MKNSFFIIIIALLFAGCESQTAFRSEKTLKKQIQGTWTLVPPYVSGGAFEEITFIEGAFYINSSSGKDTGYYSIDAKLSYSYLEMSELGGGFNYYNTTWTIVELTNDFLYLANDNALQREFIKKN